MKMDVKLGKKVFIRNFGKDEYWLQDIIYNNPSVLGLGELKSINKEKSQSTGGRLDILLKDPEDNDAMYEVEIMLGETDPSHIIRSIEYWDNEKRKYPLRQHYSVLIAESFERRYFNIIQILSLNIPMIAIQADLLEANNEYVLNFTKILDVYAEPEDSEESKTASEASWIEKSAWTVNIAKELLSIVKPDQKSLKYTQSYISVLINGKRVFLLDKRPQPKSIFWINVKDDEKAANIKTLFDNNQVVYEYKSRYKDFIIRSLDQNFVKSKASMFQEISEIMIKENKIDE
jgi:hypothetical protein